MDLYGINARYDLGGIGIKGTGELYFFSRVNKDPVHGLILYPQTGHKDTCNTIGLLASGEIIENLTGSVEYAYQFGKAQADILVGANSGTDLKRRAYAIQAMLNYQVPILTRYSPAVGLVYTRLSGDNTDDGKYGFWDPMFEDQTPNAIPNAIFANSNVEAINAKGSIKPMEDVTLSAVYGYYRLCQEMDATDAPSPYGSYGPGRYDMTRKRDLGHAFDVTALYDYTEDVQFGLTFGYFNPGSAFEKKDNPEWETTRNATQVIGSMKVTF
jgi:hypothetical protein